MNGLLANPFTSDKRTIPAITQDVTNVPLPTGSPTPNSVLPFATIPTI